jgi:hypothetical protein
MYGREVQSTVITRRLIGFPRGTTSPSSEGGRARPLALTRKPASWLAAAAAFAGLLMAQAPAQAAPVAGQSAAAAQHATATVLPSDTGGPGASQASGSAFFGLGPASATKIDGRPYFLWDATPGGVLTDHVAIVDFGATPVTLQVYVTNAVILKHGGTGFVAQGKAHGGIASWVRLHFPGGSSTLHLAPKSKVIIPITMLVPRRAAPGDLVGAIVAGLTSTLVGKHARFHLVQQVAARIVLRVSGKIRPRLTITHLRVRYSGQPNPLATGIASVSFTVLNSGNALLGGKESVSVHGLFGAKAVVRTVTIIPVMLPGGSTTESVQVRGVYQQVMSSAKVTIAPLIVSGQYDPGLGDFSASASFLTLPWIPVAVIVALLLGIAALWVRRRRRRHGGASRRAAGQPASVPSKRHVEA